MENYPIPHSGISPRSKKIRKSHLCRTPPSFKKWFKSKLSKKIFINSLRKILTHHFQNQGQLQKNCAFSEVDLGRIQKEDLESYNECVKKLIRKHGRLGNLSVKQLRDWRRKITRWNEGLDKPDNRGGRLILESDEEAFKKKVLAILRDMKIRIAESRKEKVLEIAKEFCQKTNPKKGKAAFSANWWLGFLNRHPDVKKAWKEIPVVQTFEKEQREAKEREEIVCPNSPKDRNQVDEEIAEDCSEKSPTLDRMFYDDQEGIVPLFPVNIQSAIENYFSEEQVVSTAMRSYHQDRNIDFQINWNLDFEGDFL